MGNKDFVLIGADGEQIVHREPEERLAVGVVSWRIRV